MATTFCEEGVDDYIIMIHNSACMGVPSFTFATWCLSGEQFRPTEGCLRGGRDYIDEIPLNSAAVEFSPMPWGIMTGFLPETVCLPPNKFGMDKKELKAFIGRTTKSYFALLLLFGQKPTLDGGGSCRYNINDGLDYGMKVYSVLEEFGVDYANFIPFWRNQDYVTCNTKDIYISIYIRAKKYLLIASNLSREEKEVNIGLKRDELKMSLPIEFTNMMTGARNKIYKDDIILRMPAREAVLITLEVAK